MGHLRVAAFFASYTSCKNIRLHPTGTESEEIYDLKQIRQWSAAEYCHGGL
jgi:hypothetical protein